MRFILAAVGYLVFWAALPFLLTHPKLRHGFRARLGLRPRDWPEIPPGPRVWIHGASAGDILALMPMVHELKDRRPDAQIIATTMTNSGLAMAERNRDAFAAVSYVPYDLPGAVSRTLDRIRPDTLVLEYTELWPHLINAAARRKIPIVLHNGRLSGSKLHNYRRLFVLAGNLLQRMTLLLMRDEFEADRAQQLGAPADRVHITGNTKFDNLRLEQPQEQVRELAEAAGLSNGDRVWVAGSTHEGEEEQLLDVFRELKRPHPELRMMIAPRYIDRAERIVSLAQKRGFSARRRSQSRQGSDAAVDVLVLDTIGELAAGYSLATVVFVGGSFVERGGQNILEPAACGKPVLFGPYMHNFADSVQVLLGRGGMQVASPDQLARVTAGLLEDPESIAQIGEMAKSRVLAVRGAAARNAELINALLG